MRIPWVLPFLCVLLPISSAAQEEASGPIVRVVGSATEKVQPDYATIPLGVRVQASSPEAAAARMTDRIRRVVDTLVAIGFARDSLPTRVFSVNADRDYSAGNRITGYTAVLSFNLRTSDLEHLAEFIGAALSAGATEVGGIRFGSTRAAAARETALGRAVAAARRDATIIAAAQGSTLGTLVEISTAASPDQAYSAYMAMEVADMAAPPGLDVSLVPQMLSISAQVTASWRLR